MYAALKLNNLKENETKVFELIKTFINSYEDKGYLYFNRDHKNSIDITIGAEQFTIKSEFIISEKIILFKVYAWIFDLSKESRYKQEYVPNLTFYCDSNKKVSFISETIETTNSDKMLLCHLNGDNEIIMVEPLLSALEAYTDKRQSEDIQIVRKAVNL